MLEIVGPVVPGCYDTFNTRILYRNRLQYVIAQKQEINPMVLMGYYERVLEVE